MLTDLAIRSADPGSTLWDGTLKGFGCRIGKERKTFIVLIASGRRQTLGHYPLMSLADARREARRVLAEKELGQVRPRFTAWDDAVKRYLDTSHTRPKTLYEYRRQLAHFPFERRALADVTPRHILRCLDGLPPSEKRHAFAVVRTFLNWCVYEHLVDASPCANIKATPQQTSRDRVLSPDELACLWKATEGPWCAFYAIVQLLILTGQRRGEIAALRWDWINEQERTITFPAATTKNKRTHVIPCGDSAANVLSSIPKLVDCPYVFPAARVRSARTTIFNGWSKPKTALDEKLRIHPWTLHDLRRTYSSTMAAIGVPQIVVEKLLNHVSGGTQSPISQVYNKYNYLPEARDAVLRYEAYLRTLIEPTASSTVGRPDAPYQE